MPQSQTELESMTTDLTAKAFEAFAEDIASMFDNSVSVEQIDIADGTIKDLKTKYKKLAAVCSIEAKGGVNGKFHVVFDKDGLFTLAGTFVMQPEQIIKQNRKNGTETDAGEVADAIAEVGNLMVGAWDRVFREEMPDHDHFVQSGTFMGNPWTKSEEKIGLTADAELLILSFEMTVDPLPVFKCAAIYPKAVFEAPPAAEEAPAEEATAAEEGAAEPAADESAKEEASAEAQAPAEEATAEASAEETTKAEPAPEPKAEAEAEPEEKVASAQEKTEEKPETEEVAATEEKAASAEETTAETEKEETVATKDEIASEEKAEPAHQEPKAEKTGGADESPKKEESEAVAEQQGLDVATDASDNAAGEEEAVTDETEESKGPAAGVVSETIQKMTKSPAVLPGESANIFSAICAKDIMGKDVAWGSGDDNVQQTLEKMQQTDVGYMMVGQDGVLEGIVSKSDITGAISPYLRPVFAKWHRPLDDATLQIKIKWIMSRPVHTVNPDTSLAAIMQNMSQLGQRALPVVDEQGKVQGLITVFDIFQVLLRSSNPNVSSMGKTPQAPALA